MMFLAVFDQKRGWRIRTSFDLDICGAVNEQVARETALILTAFRAVTP